MFFRAKKPEGKTVLLLDVESGSVGAGLLRVEEGKQPRLFGHRRKVMPLLHSVSAHSLAEDAAHAAREVLHHASTVAARLRGHEKLSSIGEISHVEIFLSPPWTTLETPDWHHEALITTPLAHEVTALFGMKPTNFHPVGRPLASVVQGLSDEERTLLVVVTGEMAELLLVGEGAIHGRATMPTGNNFLMRTLRSHSGLSGAEARSALKLHGKNGGHAPVIEALRAARKHFVEEFKEIAHSLLDGTRSVVIVAEEPLGEWFAQSLTNELLEDLFPEGGVVRAMRTHHLSPHIETPHHDIFLMAESLFVDARSVA